MPTHRSVDYKLAAVRYFQQHGNLAETCRELQCHPRSLLNWVKRYEEDNTVERKPRPQGAYKVSKAHVKSLLAKVKQDPDVSLIDLQTMLHNQHDVELSLTHIQRILNDNNISLKLKVKRHLPATYRGKERNHTKEMEDFHRQISQRPIDNIISMDETSVHVGMSRNYGRGKVGRRVYEYTKDNVVFQKKTLLVAINTQGVVSWKLYDKGGMTSDRMVDFLQEMLRNRKNTVVLMDNAPAHSAKRVREFVQATGNELIYSVPYSPQTNPIEEYFNQLKHYIRKEKARSLQELDTAIRNAMATIEQKGNVQNYFLHAFQPEAWKKRKNRVKPPKVYKSEN